MTLKNHKNHYNVKFLRGYGVSISVKENKIHLKNGSHDITGKSETEDWFVTKLPYEKIVISGKGYISTEALSLLNQHKRNVILTDTFGNPVSLMNGCMDSLTASKNRMAQYDVFRNIAKCKELQKWIITEKIQSEINFLKSTENPVVLEGMKKLQNLLNSIGKTEIHKIEASSARIYFKEFAKIIPAKHGFESRNQSYLRISKNHATDITNALLNYGYTVLAREISKFVCGMGLDPYFGFYHKQHTSFQPLVYDLIEPFRWLVEYAVWKFTNNESKNKIRKKDYTFTKDGFVVMDSQLIQRFLDVLERKFQSEREYEFKHGRKMKNGMSICQEITIVKMNIINLVDFCRRKINNH